MSEIPYTPLPGKMKEYFDKFQQVGIPIKVNPPWLKSIGFSGGNDHYIVKVLKSIGFIDASNSPTELWKRYKDPTKSQVVLAQGIREGYKELFETYPDANRKDREALYAFFSSKTGKAKGTVDLMVSTFTNLCQIADFEKELPKPLREPSKGEVPEIAPISVKPGKGVISEMHINIQLHLPATTDSTVYDNLFKSLKKHLLSEEE
jgi:hypothetical protein